MTGTGKVRLTGTIIIPVDEQPRFRPLLDDHVRLTDEEPGCLEFSVEQDPDRPEIFHVRELFESEAAFADHQARGGASPCGEQSAHLVRDFEKNLL
jgi:quinol monooxygenase YgiN